MTHYPQRFAETFVGYWRWLGDAVLHPGWGNYVTLLVGVSLAVFAVEQLAPWRRSQARVRKDFWLDAFYMFFNFFLFSALGYAALSDVVVVALNDLLRATLGWENLVAVQLEGLPLVAQLAIFFVVRDFLHWNIHRVLHRVPRLWEFHKVHHSVAEMGFAAHLRYHPAETIVYRTLEYLPMAMLGFGLTDFFIVHAVALTIGHLNHANVALPLGPLRYVFNSPQMHIWHHARAQPGPHGCNFGISLSLWDWVFRTSYWPHDGRDEPLGFERDAEFPAGFGGQLRHGLPFADGR